MFDLSKVKCIKADRILRGHYFVGRGWEYTFGVYSFHEVIVGFDYLMKPSGKKKRMWRKRFFDGVVGPVIWDPKLKKEVGEEEYVVLFRDGDHRRFRARDLGKFVVNVPMEEEFAFLNENLLNVQIIGNL